MPARPAVEILGAPVAVLAVFERFARFIWLSFATSTLPTRLRLALRQSQQHAAYFSVFILWARCTAASAASAVACLSTQCHDVASLTVPVAHARCLLRPQIVDERRYHFLSNRRRGRLDGLRKGTSPSV